MNKVVVFGNQQVSIDCINLLTTTENTELAAVIGCETDQDIAFGYPSIKEFCNKKGISYFNPDKLDLNYFNLFKKIQPDICFSIYYRNIFKKQYLDIPSMGFINLHPSLLPKYRGPVPTLWALLNGDKVTGTTLHYIDRGIDTGDIIATEKYTIPPTITGHELHSKLMEKGYFLFKRELASILQQKNRRIKQDNRRATYYGPYQNTLRKIDWHASTESIANQIRAFTKPYKGAVSIIGDKSMIIWEAKPIIIDDILDGPGKIVKVNLNGSFIVSGVNGFLEVQQYEIDGIDTARVYDYVYPKNKFAV